MKNLFTITICIAVMFLMVGSVQATMLDDFEDGQQNWVGTNAALTNVTTDSYLGSRSLEIADNANGSASIVSSESHGDLSALKATYIEIAIKGDALSNGIAGNTALQVDLGSDASNRAHWSISEATFQGTSTDENGWWVLHLELDASGLATLTGSTINGDAITGVGVFQDGTTDWTAIDFARVILPQGSGGDTATYYLDQLAIGQAVPEPATIGLLVLGFGFLRRRQSVRH